MFQEYPEDVKYKVFCEVIREEMGVDSVIIITLTDGESADFVFSGESGWKSQIPDILREMADEFVEQVEDAEEYT